jgi:hypothetical protein
MWSLDGFVQQVAHRAPGSNAAPSLELKMTKALLAIAPADLSQYWPQIRNEVAEIEAPDGFMPEDVYAMCKSNGATLFFLMDGDTRIGWMVCRLMLPDLHIWQLHAEIGYEVMKTFRAQLMDLARGIQGCTAITYGSTRKAWAKVAQEHGFGMRMIVYQCPIDPAPAPPAANESNNEGVAASE